MTLSHRTSFVIASIALILVFVTSGAPISLFNIYRTVDGLTNAQLGWVSLGYFVSAATALLMFGRLSNYAGRKPLAITALVCVFMSCLFMLNVTTVYPLLVARILQGFACGIASSSLGAYVVDTAKGRPQWLVAAITSTSPMIGISTGAISSGALASWGPAPTTLIFWLLLSVLAVCIVMLLLTPETLTRKAGGLRSLTPHIHLPTEKRATLFLTACVVIPTWSLGAFYQAFGPSIVAEQLGTTSAFIAAVTFSSVMILTPLGSFLAGKWQAPTAIRIGMGLYLVSATAIALGLLNGVLMVFLMASFCVGLAQGIASAACIRMLLKDLAVEERAGLLATVFIISYAGAVLPGAVASIAISYTSVLGICLGYLILGIVFATTAIWRSFLAQRTSVADKSAPE